MKVLKQLSLSGSLLALLVLAGCQRGSELGTVHGKVTQNGTPVPYAYVKFQPLKPRGTYGSAYTDAAGVYSLQFSKSRHGALVGQHSVSIRPAKRDEIDLDEKSTGRTQTKPQPKGQREELNSEFERDVKAGDNRLDFELSQK